MTSLDAPRDFATMPSMRLQVEMAVVETASLRRKPTAEVELPVIPNNKLIRLSR